MLFGGLTGDDLAQLLLPTVKDEEADNQLPYGR